MVLQRNLAHWVLIFSLQWGHQSSSLKVGELQWFGKWNVSWWRNRTEWILVLVSQYSLPDKMCSGEHSGWAMLPLTVTLTQNSRGGGGWKVGPITGGQSGLEHLETMTPTYTLLFYTPEYSLVYRQTQKTPDYLASFLLSPLTPSSSPSLTPLLAPRQVRLFGSIMSLFRVKRQSNVN